MAQPNMIQLPMAEYQALLKRVEELEAIVYGIMAREAPTQRSTRSADVHALIQELQNKYARYPSFNRALLAERARERQREKSALRAR